MKKIKLLTVGMAVPLVVTAANTVYGGCSGLAGSVTGSFGQAWAYFHCVGGSLAMAWELFYEYF